MTLNLQTVRILRLTVGTTTAVAVSYGVAWPLYFIAPIFAAIFMTIPVWIGWKMAVQLLLRLTFSLLLGLIISEFFLDFPLLCVPLYGLFFFYIYYNDTPSAPPMATLFMTLGITMVPIMGLSGAGVSHLIAIGLLFNMAAGLFFAWLFHAVVPDSFAEQSGHAPPGKKPAHPPVSSQDERARLALVSTLVALAAVVLFFSLNLAPHALAMIYICFMAGAPRASLQATKANTLATCIGGVAIILAFNLLVAVPTYIFMLALVLLFSLFFSRKIFEGGPYAAAFNSGFTTFLVLLGSSTGVDETASVNFYLRIAQVLFAGLFTIIALMVVEHFLRPRKSRNSILKLKAT